MQTRRKKRKRTVVVVRGIAGEAVVAIAGVVVDGIAVVAGDAFVAAESTVDHDVGSWSCSGSRVQPVALPVGFASPTRG